VYEEDSKKWLKVSEEVVSVKGTQNYELILSPTAPFESFAKGITGSTIFSGYLQEKKEKIKLAG
jgi:hypothetical protein